jgi:hypothetical protein
MGVGVGVETLLTFIVMFGKGKIWKNLKVTHAVM